MKNLYWAICTLLFGAIFNVLALFRLNHIINESEYWRGLPPVAFKSIFIAIFPFLVIGLALLIGRRRSVAVAFIFGLLAAALSVANLGITDLQHGVDKQFGIVIVQVMLSVACIIVCSFMLVFNKKK